MGGGSGSKAQRKISRCRTVRFSSTSNASLAHHPRVNRTPDRARSSTRLRSELCGDEFCVAARKNAWQIPIWSRVHEHSGRPIAGRRMRNNRLRRRRCEAGRLPDNQEWNRQRLSDDSRAGELAQMVVRLAEKTDAVAWLLQR